MAGWTTDELSLAIRLTSRLGYDFEKSARIMARHGYPGHTGSDLKEKIRQSSPKTWLKISAAYDNRQSIKLAGIPATPPRRRYNVLTDDFVEFVSNMLTDLTDSEACWAARLAGFNCNVTDIRAAGKRVGYIFSKPNDKGVAYGDAIDGDLCLWPVGDGACGKARQRDRYCGPHYCRSLGGSKF